MANIFESIDSSGGKETPTNPQPLGPIDPSEFVVQQPERIGRFVIETQLGHGGFGCVYRAHDTGLNRIVAIKVPRRDRQLRPSENARFVNEGRTLAKVHHPAIVSVFDVGETSEGLPFVVMEFVEGRSLRQLIRDERFSIAKSLDTLLQIGEALKVAHVSGIVHRDLKPSNVIVTSDGQIKLVDFGLALHDDLCWSDLTNEIEGTPTYMAPEQIRGENHRIDGQTDIWGLGVTMYRLLTGRMPFQSKSIKDLARQICYRQPKPLRQWSDEIPSELERICLRCLSKRLVDRYLSVADVLDELRAAKREIFEGATATAALPIHPDDSQGPSAESATGSKQGGSNQQQSTGTGASLVSLVSSLRIVPKGLQAFSETDGEFFVSLLPGPRDRHGTPESLRFWKSRFSTSAFAEFTVGLIYGPSGCGKSSFVRAGLLPQLPATVLPVYLDCAGRDTESRLVRQIHRAVESINPTDGLLEVMRQLRNGDHLHESDRVLLVLDQFEQWLSANGHYQGQLLTEALRHCDGQRVCCILLVRDDFWMSVCEFLSELEVRINEGSNAMALPLFDQTHARDVLAAIGRAYHRLPDETRKMSGPQRRFLRDAVRSVSTDGKVICVHLSVFAEMMKDKEWTSAELKRVGGLQGVGLRFLEETFSSSIAPVEGRRNESAARKILEQLLPETATTIKGAIKTEDELWRGINGTLKRDEFERAMRFLEQEVKLVAPLESQLVESEGASRGPPESESHGHYYHLAHDFLVEPIRQWLRDKKMTDRRGRAELQLENLGDHWNRNQDRRYFPGLLGFARIQWLVDPHKRAKYQPYLAACRRHYTIVAIAALVVFGLFAGIIGLSVSAFNRSEAIRRADNYLQCDPASVAELSLKLSNYHATVFRHVEENLSSTDARRVLHAHLYAVRYFPDASKHISNLIPLIGKQPADELPNVLDAFRVHQTEACEQLFLGFSHTTDAGLRTRFAEMLASLGDPRGVTASLQLVPDPTNRTTFIHSLANEPSDLKEWVETVAKIKDWEVQSGICLAIGNMDPDHLSDYDRRICREYFARIFRDITASGGAHSAAEWALRQWGQDDVVNSPDVTGDANGPWFVKEFAPGLRMTFVRIPAGEATLGTGVPDGVPTSICAPTESATMDAYYMSAVPISQAMLYRFIETRPADYPGRNKLEDRKAKQQHLATDRPADDVSWIRAVELCNWLSELDGREPCYRGNGESWETVTPIATGYRLPTSREWEYAYRAKSTTALPFATQLNLRLLEQYSWYGQTNFADGFKVGRCHDKMPLDWGLFDMPANTWEWCDDAIPGSTHNERILRGGENAETPQFLFSGTYYYLRGNISYLGTGCRLVLSIPPSP